MKRVRVIFEISKILKALVKEYSVWKNTKPFANFRELLSILDWLTSYKSKRPHQPDSLVYALLNSLISVFDCLQKINPKHILLVPKYGIQLVHQFSKLEEIFPVFFSIKMISNNQNLQRKQPKLWSCRWSELKTVLDFELINFKLVLLEKTKK